MNLETILSPAPHIPEAAPVITIFVRHSNGCKYAGDEFCKRCDCKKHFRWTHNGRQFRKAAGTRVWAEADRNKRILEDQLAGRTVKAATVQTLRGALETFLDSRRVKRITPEAIGKYALELGRFVDFCETQRVYTFAGITLSLLTKFQATWDSFYESSYTQHFVQVRIRLFLGWCREAGWIEKVPRMETIAISEPPTMPLTDEEYTKLLASVDVGLTRRTTRRRVRGIIQLMRWSGLAVRDASTLERERILHNGNTYRVMTNRQKTNTDVYVPIPPFIADDIFAASIPGKYLFWNPSDCKPGSFAAKNSQAISKVFDAAGITCAGHMVSHRLRDTFAVDLLQKGVPLEDVSKMLGHKNIKTTEDHYAKWVKGRQDRLDKLVTATWEKK